MRGIGVPDPQHEELQIPPTPTSFSQVSVGFAGAVLLLDAIRHKH